MYHWTTILAITLLIFLPAITAVPSGFKFMSVYAVVYHHSYLPKGKNIHIYFIGK
jgi:hypothetical protein